jgi:four helix bundle protein
MNNFRKLKIWDRSVELATVIYDTTKNYPKIEMYGIVSQMRRSVVSISSNIAEGAGRQSKKILNGF